MSARKNGKTQPSDIDPAVLEELFPDADDNPSVAFDFLSNAAFGRIVAAVALMGGMATIFRDSSDNSIGLSLRFGDRKRSYRFTGDDGDVVALEQLANFYHAAYAKTQRTEGPKRVK